MRDLIQKIQNIVPILVGFASLDGYHKTVLADMHNKELLEAKNSLVLTTDKLETLRAQIMLQKQSIDISDVKVEASQNRVEEL